MTVKFTIPDNERDLISQIATRMLDVLEFAAGKRLGVWDRGERKTNIEMDLTAAHVNGNPLRLSDLLDADDFNLMHDVGGISVYLDRKTGQLTQCFRPRFSA